MPRSLKTTNRRNFLTFSAAALGALAVPSISWAKPLPSPITATAITEVHGHGLRLVGIALGYAEKLKSADLSPDQFQVDNRTVVNVLTSLAADPAFASPAGSYVLVMLDPEDTSAALYQSAGRSFERKPAKASVLVDGETFETDGVNNLVVDEFFQFVFTDPENGILLRYNLFVPRNYNPEQSYPLVNFMHDASVTSTETDVTLIQGQGATVWARPEEQAKRPCFVLAPQFDVQVVNDQSEATGHVDTVKRLIESLSSEYNIDQTRIYTTGQSGGGMLSIAMNIKYPGFFAASFLVACQWDAELVGPMVNDKLFIIVSAEDFKAYPGQNAITEKLESLGAAVNRAQWNGRWSAVEFDRAWHAMKAEAVSINYVVLEEGTVIPEGASTEGAAGHMNTWPIAYEIEGVREWLFDQQRDV